MWVSFHHEHIKLIDAMFKHALLCPCLLNVIKHKSISMLNIIMFREFTVYSNIESTDLNSIDSCIRVDINFRGEILALLKRTCLYIVKC